MTSCVLLRMKSPVRQVSSAALCSPNFLSSYGKIGDFKSVLDKKKIHVVKKNTKYFIKIKHLLIASLQIYFKQELFEIQFRIEKPTIISLNVEHNHLIKWSQSPNPCLFVYCHQWEPLEINNLQLNYLKLIFYVKIQWYNSLKIIIKALKKQILGRKYFYNYWS